MAATWEYITGTTLSTGTTNVAITGIPSTYTDLVVICTLKFNNASNVNSYQIRVNADSSSIYEGTYIQSSGNTNQSQGTGVNNNFQLGQIAGGNSTPFTFVRLDFLNYAGSLVYSTPRRTMLATIADINVGSSPMVYRSTMLYSSTNSISSIQFDPFSVGLAAGTTINVYGVLKA